MPSKNPAPSPIPDPLMRLLQQQRRRVPHPRWRLRQELLIRRLPHPQLPARKLSRIQVTALRRAIRTVLAAAVRLGSTIPLHHGEKQGGNGLFYFGRAVGAADYSAERLQVYDREGLPCPRCRRAIRRIVQAARSTFYCPHCQRTGMAPDGSNPNAG